MITRRRISLLLLTLLLGLVAAWAYWNRPRKSDMAQFAPADSLAFVEGNDLVDILGGIEGTQAWRSLALPIGAPSRLSPNRLWITLARWTGLGSTDAVLFARSQAAVVFSGAEGSQAGTTLTIKPLATFIVETHTSQGRMKPRVEQHIESLARRLYPNPVFLRKTLEGVEFQEWTSGDGNHQIVFAFLDSAVIFGNDEKSVLRAIQTRLGRNQSLANANEFVDARTRTKSAGAAVFGFVSQTGIKSLLQAYALYRSGSTEDAVTGARIFADTFGGILKNVGWSATFADGLVEDRCSIALTEGVADKLRLSAAPERGPDLTNLPFVPSTVQSVSLYQLHDSATFWSDLNVAIASHTDVLGSMAARPMLKSLFKSYGIDDPDLFARAIGTRVQTIRLRVDSPAVMIVEAFDRPALRTLANRRLGNNVKSETVGDAELLLSSNDNWAAAFVKNYFLIGPADAVRLCLTAQDRTISATDAFRKAQIHVDLSLPLIALTFTQDQRAAISFVEAFSNQQRSAFATTGPEIDRAASSFPLAVSATMLRESNLEWTARSSFGIGGWLTAQLYPESNR